MKATRHIPLEFDPARQTSFTLTIKIKPAEAWPLDSRIITIEDAQLRERIEETTRK